MINLTVNGRDVSVEDGSTILQAAKKAGFHVPTLCNIEGIHTVGCCRICVVEVEGARNLQASCIVKARDGMVVHTNSKRVTDARKVVYNLMLANHPDDCNTCVRNTTCEFQALGDQLGVRECDFEGTVSDKPPDISPSIYRDMSKCILCRRCETACNAIQGVGSISSQNRGFQTVISPAMGLPLLDVNCAMCGQCVEVCPVGALTETSHIERVWDALNDSSKRTIVQVAPSVRVTLGEEFGMECGTAVTGKLAAALHYLGFDDVFDTNFGADMTIVEEGTELLKRLKSALTGGKAVLPMTTSCSPGWVKYVEHTFPEQLDHLSSCKSPHTMLGATIKGYYSGKIGVDPKDMFVVSVMPCTAKKYEIQRPEMGENGIPDVDAVLTTRELARMIRTMGIDFVNLPDMTFDAPLGFSTGAADIFGVTGGVMEAALRTVYELVTDREVPSDNLHLTPITGLESIKEASLLFENVKPDYNFLEGVEVKIAVASGLKNANILMKQVEDGTSPYHFIEIMGCPGGCINGGGQPRYIGKPKDYRERRMKAIYREDEGKKVRKSHENPDLNEVYKEFYGGEYGSHKAHELLHTTYTKRGLYNEYQ